MSLLNKGPSNSDFADGPLLCAECPLRACVRISYMRARARFLVLLNCCMNYLFLSFFRVGRAFFKVEYNINCETLSQMKTTTKNLIQMAFRYTSDFHIVLRIYLNDKKHLVYRGVFRDTPAAMQFYYGYKAASYRFLPSEDVLIYSTEEIDLEYFPYYGF